MGVSIMSWFIQAGRMYAELSLSPFHIGIQIRRRECGLLLGTIGLLFLTLTVGRRGNDLEVLPSFI